MMMNKKANKSEVVDTDKSEVVDKVVEVEVFREIMQLGQCYYHVLATRKNFVYSNPTTTYYAPISKIKYVGKFVGCKRGGYGDGSWYNGLYEKDNIVTTIHFDYAGMTCFLKTNCHEKMEVKQLLLYRALTYALQQVFQNKYLNKMIQDYLL